MIACRIDNIEVDVAPHFRLSCNDIAIPTGARVAVIGANGAGKSTLIEALLGLRGVRADVELLGRPLREFRDKPELRRRLGVQIQNVFYPRDAPVSEIMRLHHSLYGEVVAETGSWLDIARLSRRAFGHLSQGERQRVHLYVALGHPADVVFLDEPATGLDGKYAQRLYRDWLSSAGATVIMATHDAVAIEASTHTLWLANGEKQRFGLTQDLVAELLGAFRIEIGSGGAHDWLQWTLSPLRVVTQADSTILFCAERPGDDLQKRLQEEVGRFAIATTGPKDLLTLAAMSNA